MGGLTVGIVFLRSVLYTVQAHTLCGDFNIQFMYPKDSQVMLVACEVGWYLGEDSPI